MCRAEDKVNLLFSFLRTHLTAKCIVFVASCKLAHFLFEAFRRLRPGTPLPGAYIVSFKRGVATPAQLETATRRSSGVGT